MRDSRGPSYPIDLLCIHGQIKCKCKFKLQFNKNLAYRHLALTFSGKAVLDVVLLAAHTHLAHDS